MFPESWEAMEKVQGAVQRSMFLRTTLAQDVTDMFRDVFNPPFEFPANQNGPLKGCVNLDELFIPVSQRVIEKYQVIIPGITEFENVYPCAGSSDAIVKTIAMLKVKGTGIVNIFRDEYEGYGINARAFGMDVKEHDPETIDPGRIQPGVWYISNPSAIDGNILPDELISRLLEEGHKLILDLSYVGSTRSHSFNVNHKNIAAILLSPSKPYGVFEERVTGFVLLREKHFPKDLANSFLYGNRWFTDKVRTLQVLKLVQDLGPRESGSTPLYDKYGPIQKEIVGDLITRYDLPFKSSDAFLIAHIRKEDVKTAPRQLLEMIEPYHRGPGYRFCLTPYFEMKEVESK